MSVGDEGFETGQCVDGVWYVDQDDPRVEIYRDVKDRDVAGRGEYFILEGENSIQNLVNHQQVPLASVCISTKRVKPMAHLIDALRNVEVPVYAIEQKALEVAVGFHFHRGVLGCGVRPPVMSPIDLLRRHAWGEGTIVIGESISNLDNIGAIFRNAAAFGVRAVLLDERSSDPYYRKSIRVSGGHVLVVPFSHTATSAECVSAAQKAGFTVLALVTPHSDKKSPCSIVDWRAANLDRPVAVLLGAEGPGLSQHVVDLADAVVTIPTVAHVDSLNVATACAVALHEITRFAPTTAHESSAKSHSLPNWRNMSSFSLGFATAASAAIVCRQIQYLLHGAARGSSQWRA